MDKNQRARTIMPVNIAIMIAAEVILTRFISINTPLLRISFGFIPVVIVAIMYGPLWAGTAYAIGDIIGALLFPIGAFFPGYTLSAFLTGLVYGLFLHKDELKLNYVIISCAIVMFAINLGLGTLWLTMLTGKGYIALLPARALKELIEFPVCVVIITIINATVVRYAKKQIS